MEYFVKPTELLLQIIYCHSTKELGLVINFYLLITLRVENTIFGLLTTLDITLLESAQVMSCHKYVLTLQRIRVY